MVFRWVFWQDAEDMNKRVDAPLHARCGLMCVSCEHFTGDVLVPPHFLDGPKGLAGDWYYFCSNNHQGLISVTTADGSISGLLTLVATHTVAKFDKGSCSIIRAQVSSCGGPLD